MSGMPGPMKDDKGKPTRKALSLRAWNCRADGGRLMHQDILDALNLAQRRRHFAVGGFDGGVPTDANGRPLPFHLPTGLMMPDDFNNPSTRFHKPTHEEMYGRPIRPIPPSGSVQIAEVGPDYTPGGRGNNLRSLYQQELGRSPDQEGLNYWMGQLNNGMSMDQIQQMFDQSQEGQAYNQQPPPFANDPRNPHRPGITELQGLLGGGGPSNPLPPGGMPSPSGMPFPFRTGQPMGEGGPHMGDPYVGLGTYAGGNGTKAGIGANADGTIPRYNGPPTYNPGDDYGGVGQGINGQGPMPQQTPLEQLNSMYQYELGRDADEGGRNYWLQQLNNGMSMDQIRNNFDLSQEGRAYNQRMAPILGGEFSADYLNGLGNGTKAGGSGQPSFPLQNPGYPQNPNAPMPNMPQGNQGGMGGVVNGIGGMGNGTKAGGTGTKAGPSGGGYNY
jgi:hypothetical protein